MLENLKGRTQNLNKGKENRQIKRGKSAPDYLAKSVILGRKFEIEKMIGGGGFGQIYCAKDLETLDTVAVKVEPQSPESGRTVLEQRVLVELLGTTHAPRILYAGSYENFNFIVMQLVGNNLTDIRKMQSPQRLSAYTVIRIGLQMMEAIQDVHRIGYLHRDVKPPNMCVGIGDQSHIVYLMDYGMTRKFLLPDGSMRPERTYAGFRGTMRYVSLNVHLRKEQMPIDDIWSLYYSLIELSEGGLPWRLLTDGDEIMKQKKLLKFRNLSRFLPRKFGQIQCELKYMDERQVDYQVFVDILESCCKKFSEDEPFEWEEEPDD